MGKLKSFLIMGLVILICNHASGQTGCIGSITGDLYTTNTTGTNYSYGGTVIPSASIPTTFCITSVGANGSCTIVGTPIGSVSGYLTTYTTVSACDLDDHAEYIFIGLTMVLFGLYRKRRLAILDPK